VVAVQRLNIDLLVISKAANAANMGDKVIPEWVTTESNPDKAAGKREFTTVPEPTQMTAWYRFAAAWLPQFESTSDSDLQDCTTGAHRVFHHNYMPSARCGCDSYRVDNYLLQRWNIFLVSKYQSMRKSAR
jgi:hypothetical protein